MSVEIPKLERKTAKWVYCRKTDEDGNEYGYYECSGCKMFTVQEGFYSWCALCGAYMTNSGKILRNMIANKEMPEVSHCKMLPLGVKKIDITMRKRVVRKSDVVHTAE